MEWSNITTKMTTITISYPIRPGLMVDSISTQAVSIGSKRHSSLPICSSSRQDRTTRASTSTLHPTQTSQLSRCTAIRRMSQVFQNLINTWACQCRISYFKISLLHHSLPIFSSNCLCNRTTWDAVASSRTTLWIWLPKGITINITVNFQECRRPPCTSTK